jgi:hypothetical protein
VLRVLPGMRRTLTLSLAAAAMAAVAVPAAANADGVKRTAAGANPASIQAAVDAFRADVGGNNNGVGGGPQPAGRREINWDGVPDAVADPNPFPGGFFNARGIQFATPGTGTQVSANAVNPTSTPVRFNNPEFQAFSQQRLFRAVGSGITDNLFFLAGTATQATTNAMGVVFTDVDQEGSAKVEYFDPNGKLLDTVVAPAAPSGLSFAGETFNAGERVARVRITSGSGATADAPGADAVVMDDFLYGEPQVVAPPAPPAADPQQGNQPPAKDAKAPKIALLRLKSSGIRFVIASDEAGTYRIKIVLTSAQAKKLKLKKRTVLTIGTRSLQGGSNTVTIKIGKTLAAKLHKAKIKPLLTLDAADTAGNKTTQTQRVVV